MGEYIRASKTSPGSPEREKLLRSLLSSSTQTPQQRENVQLQLDGFLQDVAEAHSRAKASNVSMSLYKRGETWWYKFKHQGLVIRESAETSDKGVAAKVERKRHNELDEGAKVKRQPKARLQFAVAVKHWLALKRADWSDNNLRIETANFGHLESHFGGMLLSDISAEDISRYKIERRKQDASPRTVAMEIGSLRAVMRKHRLWADIQPDVKLPRGREDVGRALSADEEHRLLTACKKNRSRSLYPAVLLSLHTGLRNEELRLLRWRQIDLLTGQVTVGKSKTAGGTGRIVPLSQTALKCLQEWRSEFPDAQPAHYCFQPSGTVAFPMMDLATCPKGVFRTWWIRVNRLAPGRFHGPLRVKRPA